MAHNYFFQDFKQVYTHSPKSLSIYSIIKPQMDIDRIFSPEAGIHAWIKITEEIEESLVDRAFKAEKQRMEDAEAFM